MNKEKQEELSTLVDGEHDNNKQVLDHLLIDESMKDKWKRYHMIGDCLRGYLPKKINNSFLESIKKSITAEPKTPFHHKTLKFDKEPLIGFAIAASVAIFAVLGIQQFDTTSIEPTNSIVHMQEEIIDPHLNTFSFPDEYISSASIDESNEHEFLSNKRLNNYLINHSQYRSNVKMNSILPYARIVNIETEE